MTLAMPKSPSFMMPPFDMNIFWDLMSRWRILRSWMCFIDRHICTNMSNIYKRKKLLSHDYGCKDCREWEVFSVKLFS